MMIDILLIVAFVIFIAFFEIKDYIFWKRIDKQFESAFKEMNKELEEHIKTFNNEE